MKLELFPKSVIWSCTQTDSGNRMSTFVFRFRKKTVGPWVHALTSNRSDSDRTSPPIIVRFVRRVVRDQFLRGRSKLKNFTTKDIDLGRISDNKIFIQESLTSRKKALFKKCLEFKKRNNFKFIWTHQGTIFLRKSESATVMKVSYHCDLDKIDQPHSPDFEFSRRSGYAEAVSSSNLQSATQRPG